MINYLKKMKMKNISIVVFVLSISLVNVSCETDKNYDEKDIKNYSYNVEDIYTIPSNLTGKGNSVSDLTYVIPTTYSGESYNFQITTLTKDGKTFNVSYEKDGNMVSADFYIENDILYPMVDGANKFSGNSSKDSFLQCVGSHEGTALGFLTGACAGITSFIPFMQPIAFACAAETAVIASIVAADCATK